MEYRDWRAARRAVLGDGSLWRRPGSVGKGTLQNLY